MSDKKKIIEHIKSGIIVLLLISAVFLLYRTGYYSGVFEHVDSFIHAGNDASNDPDAADAESGHIVAPRAKQFSLCFGPMGRYASAYDSETVGEDYGRFSAFLAEALGTASSAAAVDEAYWIRALESESVYIDYFTPQQLSILSRQLGTELSEAADADIFASEFCLSCEDDSVNLLFKAGDKFYSGATAVSAAALRERMGEYVPNEAAFSYADKLLNGIRSSTLVIYKFNSVQGIESGVPAAAQMLEQLMPALAINEYTTSNYKESNGTSVYVDSNCVMRLSPSGYAVYELSGEASRIAAGHDIESALELCWEIVRATVGKNCGSAELYLSNTEIRENGEYVFTFDYMFDGIPIHAGSRHAAVFTIENSALSNAEIFYRSYAATGETISIIPMYQAAAMCSAKFGAGLELKYYDNAEIIECLWVNE